METTNIMMKSFLEMQEKSTMFWNENLKLLIESKKNYKKVIDNTIKFHQSAAQYHLSIINMMEAIRDTNEILNPTKDQS